MKKTALLLLLALFVTAAATAQQDCNQVDCPGICGRFVDADGDGFCDHGLLSTPKVTAQTAQTPNTPTPKKPVGNVNSEVTPVPAPQEEAVEIPETELSEEATVVEEVTAEITEDVKEPAEAPKPFRYPLFTILGITLGLYLLTFILVKTRKMAKPTHRKIWNVVLAATCIVSCLLGILLAFLLNYGYRPTWYINILHWHVYFGIAMTVIVLFHIFWHVEYYKAIFKSKK